ncbi:MAG: FadR family transcriptional regulator [Chloroflexi bacterium]|nr:FadR family transcriptional regulator [Chloroflexota bacterium]
MKSNIKPIKRKRLTDQIMDRIVSLISSGKLKKGDKLPAEHELMEQLGVGRSSLREAIGALLLTGVLATHHGRGTFVSVSSDGFLSRALTWRVQMGRENIKEIVEARIVLEQSMAGLAAVNATETDIDAIRHYLELMKKNADKLNPAQLQTDLSFHLALAKASHNATLYRFLAELRSLMILWIKQAMRTERIYSLGDTIKDHEAILNAVAANEAEKAQSAVRRHLERSANNLSYILLHKQLISETYTEI